jgi:hypothetical protein
MAVFFFQRVVGAKPAQSREPILRKKAEKLALSDYLKKTFMFS